MGFTLTCMLVCWWLVHEKKYEVHEIPGFLTAEQCRCLVARAQTNMQRSLVSGDIISESRTSSQQWLCNAMMPGARTGSMVDHATMPDEQQQMIHEILLRAAKQLGVSNLDSFECIQLAAYKPGQRYAAHYDAHKCLRQGNSTEINRSHTILVYLNDDFEGGQTHFPNMNKTIEPQTGKAVMFSNYGKDGCEHPASLHQGLPVREGTKYIANIWLRGQTE